mgnify:CR=1 FL=1
MALLEVKNLKKVYTTRFTQNQVQALTNVNFSVNKGEYVAIMGESGSGKTTLLNILAALDKPTSGQVLLHGKDITHISEKEIANFRREHLGFVFQDFNLLDNFNNRDNIFLPLVLSKKKYPEMKKRLEPIAKQLGIEGILDKFPYEISGGQKQRVAIAGILAIEPDIIIFDESTSMLDPQGKASINAQIRKLHEEKNITILSITHDMEEVAQSENVIVLENGEIAMQGTPMDIFKQEDKLAKMQLDIPFALKISKELKKRKIFKENVCRLDEVVEKLCRLK